MNRPWWMASWRCLSLLSGIPCGVAKLIERPIQRIFCGGCGGLRGLLAYNFSKIMNFILSARRTSRIMIFRGWITPAAPAAPAIFTSFLLANSSPCQGSLPRMRDPTWYLSKKKSFRRGQILPDSSYTAEAAPSGAPNKKNGVAAKSATP